MASTWLARSFGAALCALVGLQGASAQTIEVMGVGNPQNHGLHQKLIAGFAEQNPGSSLKYRTGPRENGDGLQSLLRSKLVGETLPDVFLYSGNLTRALADAELVVPLDPLIEADTEWKPEAFSASVRSAGEVRGQTYGLGFGISLPVVLFNSELVRRAGADPKALPQDWAGILALARKMDRLDPAIVGGAVEYDNGGAFSWLFLLQSHGGRFMDQAESKVAFAGPEGRAAADLLRSFGELGQARAAMTRDQLRQAFAAGTVGALVGMSSLIPRYESQAAGRFEVIARPVPLASEKGTVPTAGPIGVILARDPAKQRLAYSFLKFTAGTPGQIIVAEDSGYAPINKAAIDASPRLQALLAGRANASSYVERLAVATGWYAPPGTNSVKIGDVINDHLQQIVTLKAEPAPTLDAMAQETSRLLGR